MRIKGISLGIEDSERKMENNLVQLTPDELKRLQYKNLEIAEYLVKFCDDNGLRVFLYAGSLLGAVRHNGFIPWDDDIDMQMPAPDYKKLLEIWPEKANTDRYSLVYQSRNYNDHHLSASIKDNNTTFITDASVDTDGIQGVGIDLGPMHAAPSSKLGRKLQLICAAGCSLFKASRLPNRQSKLVYSISKVLLGIFRSVKIRYFIWNTLEKLASIPDRTYEEHIYVREFSMFPYITWVFDKKWFDKVELVPYEHTMMPIPVGAKEYLTKRYGNYMELPPEKDRHPEHRIVFMDLDTSYKEYRGTKYFVNEKK